MEQPPPLTPEELNELSANQYSYLGQPQTVKVFGILHLIFGGFGVLASLWSLYVIIIGNPFLKLAGASPEVQLQTQLEAKMLTYTVVSTAIYIAVTALIIIAGVQLLKGRKNALKWSNTYAWTSIVSKIINAVATLVFVIPITREVMSQTAPGAGAAMGSMEGIMISSMLGTVIVSCVYPILTLIFLNRPNVKTWFESQGK
jgi:hypothetical protein